jgi:hypothetical protein
VTATEARAYLVTACKTETGKAALRAMGCAVVVANPTGGDDAGTVRVAEALVERLLRRYPMIRP